MRRHNDRSRHFIETAARAFALVALALGASTALIWVRVVQLAWGQ